MSQSLFEEFPAAGLGGAMSGDEGENNDDAEMT